jgi:hypothetical protein
MDTVHRRSRHRPVPRLVDVAALRSVKRPLKPVPIGNPFHLRRWQSSDADPVVRRQL